MKWLYRSLTDGKLCKTPEDIDAAKAKGYRTLDEVMADASRNRLKTVEPAASTTEETGADVEVPQNEDQRESEPVTPVTPVTRGRRNRG